MWYSAGLTEPCLAGLSSERLMGAEAETHSQTVDRARGVQQKMGRKDCRNHRSGGHRINWARLIGAHRDWSCKQTLYGSELVSLYLFYSCVTCSWGTPNNGRGECLSLWLETLFCLLVCLTQLWYDCLYPILLYLSQDIRPSCSVSAKPAIPFFFLKGKEGGVDLGKRRGRGKRLGGVEGGKTMVEL